MEAIISSGLEQYQTEQRKPEAPAKSELGQDEFLKLMLSQMKHQDPFKPMENGEFIGQMAQFSTVSGIEQMQAALENLADTYGSSQTLEASRLVGQEVLVEGSSISLDVEADAGGRFELDVSSGNVQLDITDGQGVTVRHMDLGEFPAGRHDFLWDGLDDAGNRMAEGSYTVGITAANGDEFIAIDAMVARIIDSVEFVSGGSARLNTVGGESITLADVREIRQAPRADDADSSDKE